jgi:hypothetical protein
VINKYNIIISKDKKWETNILNPKPPQIKAFIKLQKTITPLDP